MPLRSDPVVWFTRNDKTTFNNPDMAVHIEFLKKFKCFNPLESSVGILGFFFVTKCFIGCFLFLDYRAVSRRLRTRTLPKRLSWLGFDE